MSQANTIPTVSIVIPVYNREKEIQRGLESLSNQTFKNFEVLVCDDGSTDATETVVATFAHKLRIQYIKESHNGGPAKPRNRGWRQAKAPFIAFLDSDDWWMPEKLEKSIPLLEAGADIVYHPLIKVSESGYPMHRGHFLPARTLIHPIADDLKLNGNGIPNSSVVIRKTILEKVGGFREDKHFIAWEDYDCWIRIAEVTQNFKCIDMPLGYYVISKTNLSSAQRILDMLEAIRIQYWSDTPVTELPFWMNDRKALALYTLGYYRLAFYEKLHALIKAPIPQVKWDILKVLIKWLWYIPFRIMNKEH